MRYWRAMSNRLLSVAYEPTTAVIGGLGGKISADVNGTYALTRNYMGCGSCCWQYIGLVAGTTWGGNVSISIQCSGGAWTWTIGAVSIGPGDAFNQQWQACVGAACTCPPLLTMALPTTMGTACAGSNAIMAIG